MFCKNIQICCKLGGLPGFMPWLFFKKNSISYSMMHQKVVRVLLSALYLTAIGILIYFFVDDLNYGHSRINLSNFTYLTSIIFLCQILCCILHGKVNRWKTFITLFAKLHRDKNISNKLFIFMVIMILSIIVRFSFVASHNIMSKRMFFLVCEYLLITNCLMCLMFNAALTNIVKDNNIFLKQTTKNAINDHLNVHKYLRTCYIRKAGMVYKEVTRLVNLYNILILNVIWYSITAGVEQLILISFYFSREGISNDILFASLKYFFHLVSSLTFIMLHRLILLNK